MIDRIDKKKTATFVFCIIILFYGIACNAKTQSKELIAVSVKNVGSKDIVSCSLEWDKNKKFHCGFVKQKTSAGILDFVGFNSLKEIHLLYKFKGEEAVRKTISLEGIKLEPIKAYTFVNFIITNQSNETTIVIETYDRSSGKPNPPVTYIR